MSRAEESVGRLPAAAALVVAVGTLAGQLLGVVRDIVIAGHFGAGGPIDAFLVAQAVMNVVLGTVAGALAKAVVPVVTRAVAAGHPGRGAVSVRVALTVATGVLCLAGAAMWWAAPPVISVLAPGFDRPTAELAVELTRILLVATVFVAGTNILAGAAHAHGIFVWAALQGVPFNLAVITAAAAFSAGHGVHALAVGFLVGSALRLLLQFVPLRRIGVRLVPSLRLRDPGFRELAALMPALIVISALTNVNTLVDRAVGSTAGEGGIAALNYATRLISVPQMLLVVALVTTLYPAFSAAADAQRRGELRDLVHRGATVLIGLLVPVVVVFVVAGDAVVRVIFGYGEFDDRAVALTAAALGAYALGLLGIGLADLFSRASYALGDSRAPVLAATVAMVVNVVGDLTIGRIYGVAAIAAVTSVAVLVGALLQAALLRRRHGALPGRATAGAALRLGAAGLLSAAATRGLLALLDLNDDLPAVVVLAIAGSAAVASYLLAARVAAAAELRELTDFGRSALRRRGRRR